MAGIERNSKPRFIKLHFIKLHFITSIVRGDPGRRVHVTGGHFTILMTARRRAA
jgi:hypothetical protein